MQSGLIRFVRGCVLWLMLLTACSYAQAQSPTRIQAESGTLSGSLTVKTDLPGYEGTGFVGSFANAGDQLSVSFTNVVAGRYDIRIRYLSGNQVNTVATNGTLRSEMFPDTAWAWAIRTISRVTLVSGTNTVAISKEWGWIEVDYIEIAPTTAGSGDSPTHIEAENGVLSGSLGVHGDVLGYQGSGFVGRFTTAGDKLSVSFANVIAGTYDIRIRHHSWGNQQNTVEINGTARSEMFADTPGGWAIKTVGGVALVSGTNTVAITKEWGWMDVDYIEISAPIRYHYDELGRLVQVVAPTGQSAQYSYDALGNIVSIKQFAAAAVSISEFTPNSGPAGTSVTIYGSGFSSTAANNAVSFNGTAAVVGAATTTSLVVTVPAGATSGAISVSNSNGSATSSDAFTVTVP